MTYDIRSKGFSILDRAARQVNRWFCWLGGTAVLCMTGIACINILLRPFGYPWKGAYEMVGFLGAVIFASGLGYAQITGSHISVTILDFWYPDKLKRIIKAINHLICMGLVGLLSWKLFRYTTMIAQSGETSDTLRIPFYPFMYAVALSIALLALLLFIDFMKTILDAGRR